MTPLGPVARCKLKDVSYVPGFADDPEQILNLPPFLKHFETHQQMVLINTGFYFRNPGSYT